MDITRLPIVPVVQPASAASHKAQQTAPAGARGVTDAPYVRPRVRIASGNAIQGELLHRERGRYQSTRAFLDERALGRAHAVGPEPAAARRSPAAVSSYLRHSGPAVVPEASRGQSVNLVV